jgi:hypothetical protein
MPVCLLCQQEVPKLVDSHIYPRALNNVGGNPSAPLAVIGPQQVKRSWTGIYDQFLCDGCEGSFKVPDQHLVEFVLRLDQAGEPVVQPRVGEIGRIYQPPLADPRKLRLFGLSLLLRAHLTKQDFFSSVDVGPHYPRLAQLVRDQDPGEPDEFSMTLVRPVGALSLSGSAPSRARMGGANGYWFGLPGLHVFIKVDQRPFDGTLRRTCVAEGRPVVVIKREATREELRAVAQLVAPHSDRIDRMFKGWEPA